MSDRCSALDKILEERNKTEPLIDYRQNDIVIRNVHAMICVPAKGRLWNY